MTEPTPATVGPWAKDKLTALRRYLDAYTQVLKNQRQWQTIYVDAFAGGGRSVVRTSAMPDAPLLQAGQVDPEEAELINGSPRVALEIPNPFGRYIFIEPASARVKELQIIQEHYRDRRTITVRQTDASDGIQWLLAQNISRATHRGVAFLDPFGTDLDWSLIAALAKTEVFEVIINFPLDMAIVRMTPNSGEIPPKWRTRLDAYFGTQNWSDEVYEQRTGLLGTEIVKRPDYRARLLKFYCARLEAAFGYVSQPRLIRNTRELPLYHLLWAGPHEKGLKIANYVLEMGRSERMIRKS